ncbi:hypothetical protein [Bacillus sp. V5-8f]|uniref:hypothetical protein n=1 Tax=Bacillus sp. V5-8f TaxID=2053044 RepID=UPI000C76A8A7|nr:hypothetical protein [Bacillus sp. V5-8f]PLT32798.1 hypothetical protein CUU64_16750 [Bacillus sp. V5-8f]
MIMDIYDPGFMKFCQSKSPSETLKGILEGNIRGLDKIAFKNLSHRNQLPTVVVNVLLVYFFNAYKNTVYDRKNLARIYDYWVQQEVKTFSDALAMTDIDITQLLKN